MSEATRHIACVIEWLKRPDWGQYQYMEGSGIYTHRDDALIDLNCAIAALDGARGDGWQTTNAPTDTIILAVVPYSIQRGAAPVIAMTERYVCKIDDAGDLLTEGGDDIGWRAEDITAWRECPALPGDGK